MVKTFAAILAVSLAATFSVRADQYHFDPYTGQYVGAQPPWAIQQHKQLMADVRARKLEWMRAHYVPGHTVILSNGSMVVTQNHVARLFFNPWYDSTLVVP